MTTHAITNDLIATLELVAQLCKIGQTASIPIICHQAITKAQAAMAATANSTKGNSLCTHCLATPELLPSAAGSCVG